MSFCTQYFFVIFGNRNIGHNIQALKYLIKYPQTVWSPGLCSPLWGHECLQSSKHGAHCMILLTVSKHFGNGSLRKSQGTSSVSFFKVNKTRFTSTSSVLAPWAQMSEVRSRGKGPEVGTMRGSKETQKQLSPRTSNYTLIMPLSLCKFSVTMWS